MNEHTKFKDFLKSVDDENIKQVKKILEDSSFNPTLYNNEAIKLAIEIGNKEITKILLDDPRIINKIDYDELIQHAQNSTKPSVMIKIIEDAYQLYKNRKLITSTSPSEYKSVRKIIEPSLFEFNKIENLENELEDFKIERFSIDDIRKAFRHDFKPLISVFPKHDTIKNKEFKTFLCDFELFNWGLESEDIYKHRTRFDISQHIIYTLFTNYLGRLLGNDLTLFTLNTSSIYHKIDVINVLKLKSHFDKQECKNRVFNFPHLSLMNLSYLTDPLRLYGFENYRYYNPITIEEFKIKCSGKKKESFLYNLNYSEFIKEKNTRYAITNCIMKYAKRGAHYTFLFIDHDLKLIEYYDPYVILNKTNCNLFIYKSLSEIFKGYTINRFWESLSIQKTEEFEKDETAFCVKWGHMMMHLKLLNLDMSIIEIEKKFITECANKNLSLYEVMLNYTYFMRRIIPKDVYKFVYFRKLLI